MIRQEMATGEAKLYQVMSKPPPMFNCYQSSDVSSTGIVVYTNCSIDTTEGEKQQYLLLHDDVKNLLYKTPGAMSPSTGVFNVTERGVYQVTFLATIGTNSAKKSSCDLYVDDTVS